MANLSGELIAKLLKAQNMEETAALLKAAGEDETQAERLWNEISAQREEKQLSLDELEAVSGGADRDWLTEGCAATVEYKSWCDSNDNCIYFDVTYDHPPTNSKCPVCGTYLYVDYTEYDTNPNDDVTHYRCKNCGYTKIS